MAGNYIGVNVSGSSPLGNSGAGVHVADASENTIGGAAVGAGNTIAFNGLAGVRVESGVDNAVLGNSIFSNGGLGIDLGGDGVTPNDPGDSDGIQNYPVLTSAVEYSPGSVSTNFVAAATISGTLSSGANTVYHLEFFANSGLDDSGYGEGQRYLGSTEVTTDESGNASFTVSLPAELDEYVTATATDPNNNTSEFSQGLQVVVQPVPAAPSITVQPSSQTLLAAGTVTFNVTASGTEPLSYQWQYQAAGETNVLWVDLADGDRVSGAMTATLSITNLQSGDGGDYQVVVSNSLGTVTSDAATLTVVVGPQDPSLVGWWPGDGNFLDIIGGHNGQNAGAVTFTVGVVGQAFYFNGAPDSVITLPESADLIPVSGRLTIEAWIRSDFTAANVVDDILAKRDGCNADNISYLLTVGKEGIQSTGYNPREIILVMSTASGSGAIELGSGSHLVPDDNQFHHIAATYDAALMRIYLDGQNVGEAARSGPITPSSIPAQIGGHAGTCPNTSVAAIDEVRFYNRALSAEEIQAQYNQGTMPVAPGITVQPSSRTALTGANVTFGVMATGSAPLSYQWQYRATGATNMLWVNLADGDRVSGATTATLTISNVQTMDEGDYQVVVGNSIGTATSDPAHLTIGAVTPVPLPSGAVAWWRAENDARDAVGGHDGTLENGAGFAAGEVGQGFSFDGVDDFVQVPVTTGLPVGNAPRTIELWFCTTKDLTTSTESSLIQYGTTSNDRMFGLITSGNAPGRLYFFGYNNNLAGTTVLEPNQWYHGAVTYDGARLNLYLNGQLEASKAADLDTLIDENGLTIGYRPDASGARWTGLLDELTIYNRALTAEEVQALYQAQNVGKLFISSLDPSLSQVGGASFTLAVKGSGFVDGTTVLWNNEARPTIFASSSELTATISAADLVSAADIATAIITVRCPSGATFEPPSIHHCESKCN